MGLWLLTDASYVADFKNNVEYMLSATIYVNKDGILNDNKYEYESIGHPFCINLGKRFISMNWPVSGLISLI